MGGQCCGPPSGAQPKRRSTRPASWECRRGKGEGGRVVDDEIHWVLRNARTHAREPRLRSATGFAEGGGLAPAVHRAQVGRWETGKAEVTYGLVRRYETVLGLPEGQLLSAIDYLSRNEAPVRATATLYPREAPSIDYVRALLEHAVSSEPMQGLQWEHLTSALGRLPDALIRASDWEHLLHRCAQEKSVSLGLEFALRDEAVARLAGHPRSGAVVAEAARQTLLEPSTQIYSDFVGLLQYTDHPSAVAVLVEQLKTPANSDALWVALYSLTTLIRTGRVSPDMRLQVAPLALEHLRDGAWPFRVHRAAAHLLRALRLPAVHRIATGLTADDLRYAVSILLDERATAVEALRATQARIRASITEAFGPADAQEPVLRRLLGTATATTDDESRSHALGVLMLSPQGRVLGSAYAAELRSALERRDDVAAQECLCVLSWVTQPKDLGGLTDLALDPSVPPVMSLEAAVAVGNCLEEASPTRGLREQRIFETARDLVRSRSGASDPGAGEALRQRLRGLVYVLGMRGRLDLVSALAEAIDPTSPHAVICRGVTDWWLRLPGEVRALLDQRNEPPADA